MRKSLMFPLLLVVLAAALTWACVKLNAGTVYTCGAGGKRKVSVARAWSTAIGSWSRPSTA